MHRPYYHRHHRGVLHTVSGVTNRLTRTHIRSGALASKKHWMGRQAVENSDALLYLSKSSAAMCRTLPTLVEANSGEVRASLCVSLSDLDPE